MNYVYILRCADDTLYSGWTNNLTQRLTAHNHGKTGAKYTKTRRPVALVHCEAYETRTEAMQREAALKKMKRAEKEAVIAQTNAADDEFLQVYDAKMQTCGALPRALVHRCALRHRVIHTVVFEVRQDTPGVWLQQRAFDRPTRPGAYDWTATGHIGAQESVKTGAVRELWEETGLMVEESALIPAGEYHAKKIRGPYYEDDEIASAFLHFATETVTFTPGQEVARMVWTPCRAIQSALHCGTPLPVTTQSGTVESLAADCIAPRPGEWKTLLRLCQQQLYSCERYIR